MQFSRLQCNIRIAGNKKVNTVLDAANQTVNNNDDDDNDANDNNR